jgi:hypothetical protein
LIHEYKEVLSNTKEYPLKYMVLLMSGRKERNGFPKRYLHVSQWYLSQAMKAMKLT